MATELKDLSQLRLTLPPLPETTRGYGIHLNATKNGDKFCYGNGRLVVIRSLKDPAVVDTFAEHKGRVTVAAFSPNGEWMASGDDTGIVLVWSVKTKIIKNTVPACRKVLDIAWSPDGQRIIAAGDGNESKAKAFAWDSGNNFGAIDTHSKAILSCAYKPTRPFNAITGSEDFTANFYEGPPFKWSKSLKEIDGKYINCVRYSPDGNQFAICGGDKIVIYESKTAAIVKTLADSKDGHKGTIFSLSWSPDSKQILTASADKTAKIWDVDSGAVKTTFTFSKKGTHLDQQISALWHDTYLLTASLSGAINYLDVANPTTPKLVIQGHMKPIQGFGVDKKSGAVYSGDADGFLTVWSSANGSARWVDGQGHGAKAIVGVAVASDSSHVWTAGLDNRVQYLDTKSPSWSADGSDLGGAPVGIAAANKDASLAAVILPEKVVLVRGSKVAGKVDLSTRPQSVAFSSDDKELAVGFSDGKIRTYAVSSDNLKESKTLSEHRVRVMSLNYSPNGEYLMSTDADRYIYFWGRDGQVKNRSGWTFHNSSVNDTAFNSSTSKVITCSLDQDIIVWNDLKTLEHKYSKMVLTHPTGVSRVVLLADDTTLVSQGLDRSIKVWTLK
jgi:WD40 repeat protein